MDKFFFQYKTRPTVEAMLKKVSALNLYPRDLNLEWDFEKFAVSGEFCDR